VVGQTVTAYHKQAKLLARGQILTADYERGQYRVQFEISELASLICQDTEIAVLGVPSLLLVGRQGQQQQEQQQEEAVSVGGGGGDGAVAAAAAAVGAVGNRHSPLPIWSSSLRAMEMEEEEGGEEEEEGLEINNNNYQQVQQQQQQQQQQQAQLMIFTLNLLDRKEALLATL